MSVFYFRIKWLTHGEEIKINKQYILHGCYFSKAMAQISKSKKKKKKPEQNDFDLS